MLSEPQASGEAIPAKIKVGPGAESFVRLAEVKMRHKLALALDTFHVYTEVELTVSQVEELRDALNYWLED